MTPLAFLCGLATVRRFRLACETMEGMAAGTKMRVDLLLVERGLVPSRERARALILAGRVLVGEQKVDKPGATVPADAPIRLLGEDQPYVSRGGLKLAAALDALADRRPGPRLPGRGRLDRRLYRLPLAARRRARHRRRYRLRPDCHEAAQRPARPPAGAHQCPSS